MAFTAEQATEFLKSAYNRNRLPHALLIVDPYYEGGQQVAREMVTLLNNTPATTSGLPEDEYCRVVRPQSKSRRVLVDEIREIEPFFQKQAVPGKWKIGIFPEADCINEQAANAFLKTLEEPPAHTLILLLTAYPERLMRTILSRCIRVDIFTPGKKYELKNIEKAILPAWLNMARNLGSESSVLGFRGEMSKVLSETKDQISKRMETALKETSRQISQGSGVTDWEKQMQDANVAAIEREYLGERDNMLDFFMAWFGDALRLMAGSQHLLFEDYRQELESLAKKESTAGLILRIEALERLRDDLKTNVQETLALDVRLLEALA